MDITLYITVKILNVSKVLESKINQRNNIIRLIIHCKIFNKIKQRYLYKMETGYFTGKE